MTRHGIITYALLVGFTMLSSCAALLSLVNKGTAPEQRSTDYDEDLAVHRPVFKPVESPEEIPQGEVLLALDSNEQIRREKTVPINTILDSIAVLNLARNYVDGYTILLYSGNNHEEARRIKGLALNQFPDEISILQFQQPNFRVKLGRFYQQMQAHGLMDSVKFSFPSAIIVPERIPMVSTNSDREDE